MHSCPRDLRVTQSRTRPASATRSRDWGDDEHANDIAKVAAPRRFPQRQVALLIRAFLRSREGRRNCRHNLRFSAKAASAPVMTNATNSVRQSAPQENLTRSFPISFQTRSLKQS